MKIASLFATLLLAVSVAAQTPPAVQRTDAHSPNGQTPKPVQQTSTGDHSLNIANVKGDVAIKDGEIQKPAAPPIIIDPIYQHALENIQTLLQPELARVKQLNDDQAEIMAKIVAANPAYMLVQNPNGTQSLVPKPPTPKK